MRGVRPRWPDSTKTASGEPGAIQYGEHVAGETILHFQDAHAVTFAELTLTAAERDHWMQELSQHTQP